MGHSFLGQDGAGAVPAALLRDHPSKTTFSHAAPYKGTEASGYPAKQATFSNAQLGRPKPNNKSGSEPAMLALRAEAATTFRFLHGIDAIPEVSPVGARHF